MSRIGISTQNRRSAIRFATNRVAKRSTTFIMVGVAGIGLFALLGRTSIVKSRASITAQAAGRGQPYFNFRDGRELQVAYRGDESLTAALRSDRAQPRSIASIDLDRDGTPDVVAGYAYGGAGIVTIQHGNPDAFAPKDESVFARIQQGYNPESLLPSADVYPVPVAVDFLQVGDFNHDNQRDVLVGASNGQLFLLPGDGRGGFGAMQQIDLPGPISSMTAGEFRAPDGWTDVAVGVVGPAGPELLIFDGVAGVTGEAMHLSLPAPAAAVEFGELDSTPFMGIAVATGSQIEIVHGWGRKESPALQSRVEMIDAGANVRGVAIGSFVWSREGTAQIAALGEDGTIRVLTRGALGTQPFSDAEITTRARSRQNLRKMKFDVEALVGWQAATTEQWATAREVVTGNVVGANATAQNLLQRGHISFLGTDDLLVMSANQQKLDIVRQTDATAGPKTGTLKAAGDMVTASLSTAAAPVTVLALPQKLNGERDLFVMQAGSASATVIPLAVTGTITVDRTDDPSGGALAAASACSPLTVLDCSLRGAVQFANANAGTTINLPAGTYILATSGSGGCTSGGESNVNGDLEINPSTTLSGAGSATTIIRQAAATNDRVICLDVPLAANTYIFSGMTITGGRDAGINGGAGLLGGAKNAVTNFTDVTFANNQTSNASFGGGGITVTGGNMTVTNCTFGAANPPGANRNDLTLANASFTSGGGIAYTSGDPAGTNGATGTLTVTGTTFTHNTASGIGGGGLDVFGLNVSTPTVSVSTTSFTNNQGLATASGGGLINEAANVTVATTSFTSNSANNRGGGLYAGGGSTLLDGTTNGITFTSNTAVSGGSSVSTAAPLNVAGTNTTIGGSIEITLGGVWTNNTGSTLNPTDIVIAGGTMTCNNSTMNVSGNLTLGPSGNGLVGGTFNGNSGTVNLAGNLSTNTGGSGPAPSFNGNTGTFTFNGAGAQSSGGTLSPTFNNLTVNKGGGTLTLGVNSSVTGNLTVTAGTFDLGAFTVNRTAAGGTLTVSNGATLKIGGPNTLPSNYTTHSIGATSTIEYSGTGQTVSTLNSAQTYGNLTISGSGTKTLQAATTVATNLTINAGTLDVSASNFALNVGGNFTNNVAAANFNPRAGTVTFNGSGAQTINGTAATQTFNNFVVNKGGGALGVGGSTTSITTNDLTMTAGTFNAPATLTINGNTTLTAGTLVAGTSISTAGNWTNNGGTFTPGAGTVTFGGAGAQAINGTAATQTFNNFTVNKPIGAGVLSTGGSTTTVATNNLTMTFGTFTAPATLDINGNALLTAGILNAGANITAAGNWTNNGTTFTAGAGTVAFDGGAGQTISGTTATTFNNFTVSNASGISMNNSNTVNGLLALTSGNITVAGGQTLAMPNTGSSSGGFDVIGNVLRTGFVTAGPALSFGNPFNTIQIAVGTAPTNINVNLVKAAPAGFAAAVQRTYTITPTGGSGITATLRLHYLDAELNGNPEATLNLRRFNGTGWAPFAATAADTTNNWVENNAVHTFSPWTLSSFSPTASNGTVSGRITDGNGMPVSGAVINLSGAQSRKTITDSNGNYLFDNIVAGGFYSVTPTRANYSFNPTNRSFSQIGNQTEAVFTAVGSGDSANPLDTPEYFVRQQYLDVLRREPDESGFNYWSDQLLACGADALCLTTRRRDVAAAFFIEREFQVTGGYIYDVYAGALGRQPAFNEYSGDRQQVVGGADLDAAKTVFARNFVQRAEFAAKYQANVSAASFVAALIQNVQTAGVDLSGERDSLISAYNTGGSTVEGRAAAVRAVAEDAAFSQSQYNSAFVLTEYFSYLQRDAEPAGFNFWVNVLNNGDPGNYRGMVCSFITSAEYQRRFSGVVSHNNGECSGQ